MSPRLAVARRRSGEPTPGRCGCPTKALSIYVVSAGEAAAAKFPVLSAGGDHQKKSTPFTFFGPTKKRSLLALAVTIEIRHRLLRRRAPSAELAPTSTPGNDGATISEPRSLSAANPISQTFTARGPCAEWSGLVARVGEGASG
jgi:hypothetical protein